MKPPNFHLTIQKCWGQKVAASSRDQAINRPAVVLQKGYLHRTWTQHATSWSNMSGRCATSQYPSIHGGLHEHYDPTDTLTGVDGRIREVGDTAAGLWNEYGWSRPAAEGQTVGR